MLLVRGLVGGFFQIVLFALLLLLPASLLTEGRWQWPRAWYFLGAYGLLQATAITILAFAAPRSLEARLARSSKKQPKADRIILWSFIFLFLAWFAFIPIDVFYLRLWPAPSPVVSACGVLISLVGYLIVLATIYQNEYAKPIVEVQDERGHEVIDTGLYAVVRHPMYMGVYPWVGGLALWLESYASAVLGLLFCCVLVVRIHVEEKALRKNLKGYEEYTKRVKYRLIPFVW